MSRSSLAGARQSVAPVSTRNSASNTSLGAPSAFSRALTCVGPTWLGYSLGMTRSSASNSRDDQPSTKPLLDKLGVKPQHRVAVLNLDDRRFVDQLWARTP